MKLHKAARPIHKTQYHIVWVTRYPRKILDRGIAESLRIRLQEVWKLHADWFTEEVGIQVDRIYVQRAGS
jgi:REP element-mobilizing transposase RayT